MTQDTTEGRFERLEASHFRTGEDLTSIKAELQTLRRIVEANQSATIEEFGSLRADISEQIAALRAEADTRHTAIMEALNTLLGRT